MSYFFKHVWYILTQMSSPFTISLICVSVLLGHGTMSLGVW
jgi:hypothetical protein